MHELAIAEAIAGRVGRLTPPGRVVSVEVRVGPMRGIEPAALRMCWDAVTRQTPLDGAALEVEALPWSIACDACGRSWTSGVPFVSCACGSDDPRPRGGDDLDLVAVIIEEEVAGP